MLADIKTRGDALVASLSADKSAGAENARNFSQCDSLLLGDASLRIARIIVIEPDGLAREGSYVLAWNQEEWTFRQLLRSGAEWVLHPLNPEFEDVPLEDFSGVRGVIFQKALPGRRRASKRYI